MAYSFKSGPIDEDKVRDWLANLPAADPFPGLYYDPDFGLVGPQEPNTEGAPAITREDYERAWADLGRLI